MVGLIISATLVSGQLFKVLFNIFSFTHIPADRWTITELISALINMISFLLLNNLQVETVKNINQKQYYDYLIIFVMLFTWIKFLSFFLVIKGISNHFITIYKMFQNALNFILMVLLYQIFMAIIMYLLFNYYDSSPYSNLLFSLRYVIDLLNGNYDRSYYFSNQDDIESYLTIIHILISKIILVSLIVALFMTTFQIMYVKGDFVCKSYRYEYIERYQLALKDEWGYSELVITPPPLNILLVLIIPFVLSRPSFK